MESDSKYIYNVRKNDILNKCCSSKSPVENESKILSSTNVFNIDDNIYWAQNQYIRIISEGSCDTEDWNNDAENSALLSEI